MEKLDLVRFNGRLYASDGSNLYPLSRMGGGGRRTTTINQSSSIITEGFFIEFSSDGSSALINGNTVNHFLRIRVSPNTTGINVGDTITNNTSGASGTVIAKSGVTIDINNFTSGLWLQGDQITNGSNNYTISNAQAPIWYIPLTLQSSAIEYIETATSFGEEGSELLNSKGNQIAQTSSFNRSCIFTTISSAVQETLSILDTFYYLTNRDTQNGWFGNITTVSGQLYLSAQMPYNVGGVNLRMNLLVIEQ